jgi:molybdopterin-binding protein
MPVARPRRCLRSPLGSGHDVLPVSQAAALLGVSDDTVRRYIAHGRLPERRDESNRRVIDGVALAAFAREHLARAPDPSQLASSARNRLVGLVTDVQVDKVMAQVEIQCGPHRVVSLISREAIAEMGLTPGALAVAMIKSTNVVVEVPMTPVHRPDEDGDPSAE